MKRIVAFLWFLTLFFGLSAAEVRPDSAAVSITDGKAGAEFFIFGTGSVGPLDELGATLKRENYRRAVLSSWRRKPDCEAVARDLRQAGIEIEMFYYLDKNLPDYHRLDFVKTPEPEPAAPPPETLVIRDLTIEDNAYNRRWKLPGKFKKVQYITIHNTAEPFSAAQERDRVNSRRDDKSVSFHFAVDENEAVQIMPLDTRGWHAGDGGGPGNAASIGIEICRSQCRDGAGWRYRRAEANAVKLAARLLRDFDLPVEALRTHQSWSGKFCPHRILEAKAWDDFRARVRQELANPAKPAAVR